jgi:hypothetical protein
MSDKVLDSLYSLYYNELIRYKLTPSYVEKRILLELLGSIKSYIISFADKLKDKIEKETKKNTESYLTWDKKYYENDSDKKIKLLDDFMLKVKNTFSDKFLSVDFSITKTDLDKLYPNFLPKSSHRETFLTLWNNIKNKHD